ncbi:type IV secretion system protein [Herbaspirillum sp. SJZ107]|uniref:type IV secretion system protein n=1 Tax=Herbaspirillum sp. SJZ107 TaxID=2572881 RepID=UPI0011549AED|nr:type IV secretion system protein [Herbaspirillum sp. SJZ107]TQK03408.1 type IV secretion system protein VirB5 [Herbaspirillum sp. SJZ107]
MRSRNIIAAVLLCSGGLSAQAQMVVTDPTALAEAVKQVRAWEQQYAQMRVQIDSMTGNRGMAALLPASTRVLPADWTQSMTQLSALAQEIRSAQAVLTPAQAASLSPALQSFLSQSQNISAANQAMAQAAYNDATVREQRLRTLTGALATTNDPKAAYDLSNAIAIEHAALVKDQNQLAAAGNGATAQTEAERLMVNQMRATSSGQGNFPTIDTSLP